MMLHLFAGLSAKRGFYTMILLLLVGSGCNLRKSDVQQVIDAAVVAHGWQEYRQGAIAFRQDKVRYRVLREDDAYLYSRTFEDGQGQRVHDVLDGTGFTRTLNDVKVDLGEKENQENSLALRRAVFFALLPYTLSDTRTQQKYEGNMTLHGQPYHKIRITTRKQPGKVADLPAGTYLLWFNKDRHTLDYFVYEPDAKDNRSVFCEAVNPRTVAGIRFQDYNLYATKRRISPLRLDYAFEAQKLDKVSEIKMEDVNVSNLPPVQP